MAEHRPSPDVLLKRIKSEERQETRGKLKIYLGAAPGVGKTYTMLEDALSERAKGLDVVIGVVESHGRREIETMLRHLEKIPLQTVEYRGKVLPEFDIEAALKRQPGLILIDEMAHANAPGVRHAKRWQDIKELLDRGMNVYTTLNVQHIESINDDVSQIIHAPVKETIPDMMLEVADTIELVDLPPEDLLKRLEEGKIYIPEQAQLAVDRFFQKGNLIALRELALRITAQRVSADVLLYRQGLGINHIWPTKEKILVCVGARPESIKLIRAARRMAASLQGEWVAVYVETPTLQSNEAKRNKAIQNLHLAEQLGAHTRVLNGFDIVREVMRYSREQNVTLIMVWKHIRTRLRDLFFPSLADELVRHSHEIDVYIMTGEIGENYVPEPRAHKPTPWVLYVISICIISLVTIIDVFLYPYLPSSNLIMFYILGVATVSLFGEIGPALLASMLSVFAYDYFCVPPLYTFSLNEPSELTTLLIMFLVTEVISALTILSRRQVEAAQFTEKQTTALYVLSRQLARTRGIDNLLNIGIEYISDIFNCDVLGLIPEQQHLVIRPKEKAKKELDEKEMSVAQWVYDLKQAAGFGTDTLAFSDALYLPLLASEGCIGVLRIRPKSKILFTPEQMHLIEACANQIALALEVDRLQTKILLND